MDEVDIHEGGNYSFALAKFLAFEFEMARS